MAAKKNVVLTTATMSPKKVLQGAIDSKARGPLVVIGRAKAGKLYFASTTSDLEEVRKLLDEAYDQWQKMAVQQ